MNKIDNEFVEQNQGLVHLLANRFRGRGIEYEELFSAGCMGLIKAARGFDESRGLQFSTYAVPVILGEIKRLFRDGGMVKVSRSLKELSLKVTRVKEELLKEGKEARVSDIAEILGESAFDVTQALAVSLPPISLTAQDEDGYEFELPIPAKQTMITEKIALEQCLDHLSPQERRLVYLRYFKNETQSQVGKELGMSQVQVSRAEKQILLKLREMMTC